MSTGFGPVGELLACPQPNIATTDATPIGELAACSLRNVAPLALGKAQLLDLLCLEAALQGSSRMGLLSSSAQQAATGCNHVDHTEPGVTSYWL
jgi:hypothetical protein